MSTPNDFIIHGLIFSQQMLQKFTEDLSPQELLHRPTPKANCAAWLIGHLAVTDRKVLGQFKAEQPQAIDGFDQRFSRDEGCPQAEEFGDLSVLLPVFHEHRERVIAFVRSASDEALDRPLDMPHPRFKTIGELANFVSLHTMMHAGQISIIRRSLGRPPIV